MASSAETSSESSSETLPTESRNFQRRGTPLSPIAKEIDLYRELLQRFPDVPFIARGHVPKGYELGIPYYLEVDSAGRVTAKGDAKDLGVPTLRSVDYLLNADLVRIIAVEPKGDGVLVYEITS